MQAYSPTDPWRIDLFGGLCARRGDQAITRFRTQKTGALLAYLAYFRQRSHLRETLVEQFWPDEDVKVSRNRFRVALNALRTQLETDAALSGFLFQSDHTNLQINPQLCVTDVSEFEAALLAETQAAGDEEKNRSLITAVELVRGELLPGYDDWWVGAERQRLADAYLGALRRLVKGLVQAREYDRALDYALRAVREDPLREDSHRTLMRLYSAIGRPAAALSQYRELERRLRDELGAAPSVATRELAEQFARETGTEPAHVRRHAASSFDNEPPPVNNPATIESQVVHRAISPELPSHLTRFFGREDERAQLVALLGGTGHKHGFRPQDPGLRHAPEGTTGDGTPRLVTLTGPGGSGKTRLTLEVAAKLIAESQRLVFFVPLADLTSASQIPQAIAEALHLHRAAIDPIENIISVLSVQPVVLILDNFEHLTDDGALIVRTLLERLPQVTALVTSRHKLEIAGEREFPVLPLPLPDNADTLDALRGIASVQLFEDRARAVYPAFRITSRNMREIAELCSRLEGIPLAIELAAAWAHMLTPSQMLSQLDHRLDFLVSRQRDALARHRTLRAAIDWSYQILEPGLQRFFTRLSVFRGGWTLQAAAEICGHDLSVPEGSDGDHTSRRQALDYLTQLRERSLVMTEEVGGEMRGRLLETLREYAAEQLPEDERHPLYLRHCLWCLALAEQAEPHLIEAEQTHWLQRLEMEHDNLRSALAWCRSQPDMDEAELRLAGSLWRFWSIRGHFHEGRDWLRHAVARAPQRGLICAKALLGSGELAYGESDFTPGQTLVRQALAIYREAGDKRGIAQCLLSLAPILKDSHSPAEAFEAVDEALRLCRELSDRWGTAFALFLLGELTSELEPSRAYYIQSLALFRELGEKQGAAYAMEGLSRLYYRQGDYASARAILEEGLSLIRELGDKWSIALILNRLGDMVSAQKDFETARSLYEESLVLFREMGTKCGTTLGFNRIADTLTNEENYTAARDYIARSLDYVRASGDVEGVSYLLCTQAQVACKLQDYDHARCCLKEALSIRQQLGLKRAIANALSLMAHVEMVDGNMALSHDLRVQGLILFQDLDFPGGVAYALEGLAALTLKQGDIERAARLCGATERYREIHAASRFPKEQQDYERYLVELRAAADADLLETAWEEGRAMPQELLLSFAAPGHYR